MMQPVGLAQKPSHDKVNPSFTPPINFHSICTQTINVLLHILVQAATLTRGRQDGGGGGGVGEFLFKEQRKAKEEGSLRS